MSLKLTMEAGGLPVGAYTGPLVAIETVEADEVRGYGAGLKWVYEVDAGPQKGARSSRITPAKLTGKNATSKILEGMLGGKMPALGEELDVESLIGKRFLFMVASTKSGATRIENVSLPV